MAEPARRDDALAAAVREAFQRHMENARLAGLAGKTPSAATTAATVTPIAAAASAPTTELSPSVKPVPTKPVPAEGASVVALVAAAPKVAPVEAKVMAPAERAPRTEAPFVPAAAPAPDETPSAAEKPTDAARPDLAALIGASLMEPEPAEQPARSDLADVRPQRILPPAPANDGDTVPRGQRLRERALAGSEDAPAQRGPAVDARGGHFGAARSDDVAPARGRSSRSRQAANTNGKPASRWRVVIMAGIAAVICVGGGIYMAMKGDAFDAPASPAPPAAKPAPSTVSAVKPTAGSTSASRSVKTVAITLDAVDIAVQEAREHVAQGDLDVARQILEPYRASGDGRALFALAETFDPSVVHDPKAIDVARAQELYEAAGRAGFQGTADRLAKLQPVVRAN